MKRYLSRKIRDFPYKFVTKFRNLKPENAISIFCDPRGGSTWLAETLNSIPNSMIIEEPLNLNNFRKIKELGFCWRQYIPEDSPWAEAKVVFKTILEGKDLNAILCRCNTLPEVVQANQLILKIIRGKALLPWYVKQFNFKYQPVVVVRHPFAIAASMLNHKAWDYDFQPFEIPNCPHNTFYKEHEEFLYALKTKEEQLTALWCMVNNVVLHHPENDCKWISFNYEDLVLEPQKHFDFLFRRWGKAIPEGLMDRVLIPSSSTMTKNRIDPEVLLSDWKNKLTPTQIEQLQKVLDYFGVDYYNGKEALPLIPARQVHLNNKYFTNKI